MPTHIEVFRKQYEGKPLFDLVVAREQSYQGTPERQVLIALIEVEQQKQLRKTRLIAWLALIVAVVTLALRFWDEYHATHPAPSAQGLATSPPKS